MARNRMSYVGGFIPAPLLEKLDRIADEEGLSRSATIRKAVEEMADRFD